MPCEGCNVQFTVFKRKHPCTECRRYFCNHCLTKRNQNILCDRCVIFTRRPLTRADLLNLKPKDLIFYLQSKHISTTGCVEKEELVNLILANTDSGAMPSNGRNSHNSWTSSSSSSSNSVTVDGNGTATTTNNATENCTNTFDQLKQTCQNFFSSFTDRISNDLGFDTIRNNTTSPTSNSNYNNYCDNDGIITREIPTYAESINRSTTSNVITQQHISGNRDGNGESGKRNIIRPTNFVPNTTILTTTETTAVPSNTTAYNNVNHLSPRSPILNDIFSSASSPSSPINSLSSISSQSISSQAIHNPNHRSNIRNCNNSSNNNSNNHNESGKSLNNCAHHQVGKFENVSSPIDSRNKKINKQMIFENVISDSNGSGCDCSDDEVITKYTKQQRTNSHKTFPSLSSSLSSPLPKVEGNLVDLCSPISQSDSAFEDQIAGPSGSAAESGSNSKSLANESNETAKSSSNGSSGSSFEELGAVGGSGGGGGGTSSDNENWQMVHKVEIPPYSTFTHQRNSNENSWNRLAEAVPGPSSVSFMNNSTDNNKNDPFLLHSNVSNSTERVVRSNTSKQEHILKQKKQQQQKPTRRITRRRSDSYIYRQNQFETTGPSVFQQLDEESDEGEHNERKSHKRVKKSCKKCGKSKKSIEGQVDKFKKQLESSNLSANEIKRELAAFVDYLEQRAKSFDCSDDSSETNHDNQSNENGDISDNSRRESRDDEYDNGDGDDDDDDDVIEVQNNDNNSVHANRRNQQLQSSSSSSLLYNNRNSFNGSEIIEIISDDSNDGIHVYAQEDETYHRQQHQPQRSKHDPRFINLSDFKSSADLDDLSVKQLKEILMLNRVDFKGCCEKQELLERVKRLWKELQSCPEVEKLPADDLCKICMDAPIECVILECGHMATCTNCGKVLSECPICRQYIVRIVRFFRA